MHHRVESRTRTTPPQVASGTGASAAGTSVVPATVRSAISGESASAENVQKKTSAVKQPDDNEYAEEFVPVPYAEDPAALEGGAIVRVTLPRSALASFGLPITESDGADRVSADLIVSQDGTPQAIRLVSQAMRIPIFETSENIWRKFRWKSAEGFSVLLQWQFCFWWPATTYRRNRQMPAGQGSSPAQP